jgi:ATP-dependent DNA helicase RecG
LNLIFVSSRQVEFDHERKELCYFVLTDPYLKQFFDVFLFENLPANQRDPQNNYLGKVRDCSIYLGLFGRTYGTLDGDGISATEREFDYATELGKDRIVYVRTLPPSARQARRMTELIAKAQAEVTYNTFESLEELKRKVMQSLLYWQQNQNRRSAP